MSLRPQALLLQVSTWAVLYFSLFTLPARGYDSTAREVATLDASALTTIVSTLDPLQALDPFDPASHLAHILIPRPSGSANNTLVRNYIVDVFKRLKWHVEEDAFTDSTPYGDKSFTNVIATWEPKARRRFIMSAHFDSKYFAQYPQNQFVGATDSAAPCALLLDLAEALTPMLEQQRQKLEEEMDELESSLQFVFFDGEEAFKDWVGTDNTYGARHLAEKWATTYIDPSMGRPLLHPSATIISTVDHLVLLDLLGVAKPLIRSYFPPTAWLFDMLVSAEKRLGESGVFNIGDDYKWESWDSFFVARTNYHVPQGFIGDDHIPFLQRGVPVLHLIAQPFPKVWHTLQDDVSALDMPTMKRWAYILRVFTAEYLGLTPTAAAPARDRADLP